MTHSLDSRDSYVTMDQIDQAWFDLLECSYDGNGHIFSNLVQVNGSPVRAFIRKWPFTEGQPDRPFPCIALELKRMPLPARVRRHSGDGYITISEDLVGPNPNRTVMATPEPYNIEYRLHLFSRKIVHDNQMLNAIIANISLNDTLNINDEDWHLFSDRHINLDTTVYDQLTYHKVFEYRLEVNMALSGTRHTQQEPIITDAPDFEIENI